MIKDWLDYIKVLPRPYTSFDYINISEKLKKDSKIESFLSKEVLNAYVDLDFLKLLYNTEPEIILRNYLTNEVFPSATIPLSKNVFQGDFGETLAGLIVKTFQNLIVPLNKLRWKLNHNKSVFCTDLFAHNQESIITDIYYFEVKARYTIRKEKVKGISNYVTVNAHNSLLKDEMTPNESIANFLSERFYESGDYESCLKYSAIVKEGATFNRNFELFFIIEETAFIPEILVELNNLPPTLKPLAATVVLIENLQGLILNVRQKAIEEAVRYVYS